MFRSRTRLQTAIDAGIADRVFRSDDLEFVTAARGWGECVSFGNFDLYERRFMETASEYFELRSDLHIGIFSCFGLVLPPVVAFRIAGTLSSSYGMLSPHKPCEITSHQTVVLGSS